MSEHNHTHTHVDENGHVYEHSHSHHHSHAQTKAVLNRLSRAQGHLDAVRKMVERGEDCAEVLVQLSAVISALNGTAAPFSRITSATASWMRWRPVTRRPSRR